MYYKDKCHRVSAHHNTQIHKLALSGSIPEPQGGDPQIRALLRIGLPS